MKRNPAGAGYDGNPRRRLEIAAGETRLGGTGLSSYSASTAVPIGLTADVRRPETVRGGLKPSLCSWLGCCATWCNSAREQANLPVLDCGSVGSDCGVVTYDPADLTSEAAETLRSPNGGVPAVRGEAAVTRDRRDRERQAVRSRGGGERSPSRGWRGVAREMCASEGCSHR